MANPRLKVQLKMTGLFSPQNRSKTQLNLSPLTGKTTNSLMILKTISLKVGMKFLKKLSTLKPRSLKIGMMNSMVTGRPLECQTLNSRESGDQNKSKILSTKANGFTQ